MGKRKETPIWKSVVAGGTAGVIELGLLYPTDVVKTRMQVATSKESVVSIVRSIWSSQGLKGFYRGIAAPIAAEAPKRAWKFGANEKINSFMADPITGKLTLSEFSMSGALAGVSEALVNCPFETVKVRMQTKEFLEKFKGSAECLVYLLRHEGLSSVYKGLEAQMWRNGFWNAAYFGVQGSLEIKRQSRPSSEKWTKGELLREKFVYGALGGILGTLFNTPFDVAKSRLQNQVTAVGTQPKYRWTWQSLGVIYSEEGFGALYKGIGARIVRLTPGGGIMIVVVDVVTNLLKDF